MGFYGCGRAGTYRANRQYGLMDKGIIHYSLFIFHFSLFIFHFSLFTCRRSGAGRRSG